MNQLRVGVSRLVNRSQSVSTQVANFNMSSRIFPATHRVSLEFQSVYVWPSHNFINYSTCKTAHAEASPNSSGNQKSEDGTTTKTEDAASEVETQLRAEVSKSASEVAALRAKAREFEDKYLLALADMENLRTRMNKQVSDAKLYATQSLCKDLTDIEDILQMAINSVPKDQISNSNKHLKELYEGLTMTEARLLQIFKSHGLTQINPINTKFNPNEHEAVMQKEEEGKESGTIIFVSKLGYKLHDRVIRPAVVGVAK